MMRAVLRHRRVRLVADARMRVARPVEAAGAAATSRATTSADRFAGRAARQEAAARALGEPGEVGQEPEHLVLGVDRARPPRATRCR